jgi:carbon monoxide dehydrogenase subunit G
MQVSGEQRIGAPRQRVWVALNDPVVLAQCIPGCQSLEKEGDNRFAAVAEIKIGPIGARFRGNVQLSDIDAPSSYTITGSGNGGIAGAAKGSAKVKLSDTGDGGTLVTYTVDAEVGGRMAQLGGPIIDATAKQLAAKFFGKFGDVVSGAPAPAPDARAAMPQAPASAVAAAPVLPASGFPWVWLVVTVLAILAGFLLGRSAAADWWVVAVATLVVVVAAAGYEAGRRGGGR